MNSLSRGFRQVASWPKLVMMVILLTACSLTSWAGDDARDDLPGVTNGPSRDDVAALIRKIGRDEPSDANVDEILSFFLPRAKSMNRSFEKISALVTDPVFVARMDVFARDLTGKPADTRNLIVRAINENVTGSNVSHRDDMADELKRRAEPAMTLKGKVVNERDRGIPGVQVTTAGAITHTDAKGRFVLQFRRPRFPYATVSFEAKGYGLGETSFDLDAIEDANDRTYPLLPQAVCDGTVVDLDGKPIAGAEVTMWIHQDAFNRNFGDEGLRAGGNQESITLLARSGPDGRYAFRNLPPRGELGQYAYTISASHPRYLSNQDSFGNDQEPRPNITIPLTPGASISGVVSDPAGKPVARAEVRVIPAEGNGWVASGLTDASGEFRFENLAEADYRISVEPEDFALTISAPITVSRAKPSKMNVDVKPGAFIEGTVIGPEGKPAEKVRVGWIVPTDDQGMLVHNKPTPTRFTQTAADGSFKLGPLPEGSYRVLALIEEPLRSEAYALGKTGQKDLVIRHDGESP